MKLRTQRIIGFTTLGYAAVCATVAVSGVHANFTDSAPIGLWTFKPVSEIKRGILVTFCIPATAAKNMNLASGDCPGTYTAPFLKSIAAIEGDIVQIKAGYPATVNGKEIPNTIASPKMQSWSDGIYTVMPGEVWVFSSYTHKSYDSRYFGPIGVSTIQGEAIPLLVVGNAAEVTGTQL